MTEKGSVWLDRSIKIGAIIGALWTLASYGLPLVALPTRVEALELDRQNGAKVESVKLFMLCGLYRKAYMDVPALCDDVISKPVPR